MIRLFAYLCVALAMLLPARFANAVVITFDDVDTSAGAVSGAPVVAYLASYGITYSGLPGSGAPTILPQAPGQVIAPSEPNLFGVGGILSDYGYVFDFAAPIASFTFTTPALGSSSTMAAWTATAYSAANAILSSINQYSIHYPGTPETTWTLIGPAIDHVEFHSNVQGFAGNALQFDDVTFTLPAVPEPAALSLLGIGLLALGLCRRKS